MYVDLEEARKTVWPRWRNLEIRRKVMDFVGEIPDFLRRGPRAVLARQLATPNLEFLRFSETASKSGLRPILIEYTGDKFCSANRDKLLLGKMTFHHGRGKNGDHVTCRRIIDFNRCDGKAFTAIRTVWEEGFIDFHHRLLVQASPAIVTADVTAWLKKMGGEPKLFWPRLFALFTCHGILFDNFHGEGHEAEFTERIIRPALRATEERFGLSPLIVPIVPIEREREAYWSWYPDRLEEEVNYLIAAGRTGFSEMPKQASL